MKLQIMNGIYQCVVPSWSSNWIHDRLFEEVKNMPGNRILHLNENALDGLNLSIHESIAMLEKLISGSEANTVFSAPKAVLTPPDGRYIMATLAAMDDPPLVATKSLVLNDANRKIGLPPINSLVTLLHGETGVPIATMDGNWITATRTAALSAVAASHMANPDVQSIGFVGTGVQARSHLEAFCQMFPIKHIKMFGRGQVNLDRLSKLAATHNLTSEFCDTAQAALSDADMAVTTVTHTGVSGPFLTADWLASGSFVSVVDLGVPWHKETFAGLDRLIIDDLAQEEKLATKLAHPDHIDGDLAGLVMKRITGRAGPGERTAFVFRGHALGDLALAALAYLTHQNKQA